MREEQRLGTEKIGKLMFQLAVPSIIAQFINVLYNMVDRIYIGRIDTIGTQALTGLGLCFPIIMIVTAFSAFAAAGGAPLAAIALGENKREEAEKIMGNSIILLVIFSIILPIVVLTFQEPLLYLFGASDATIIYAKQYLSIYMLGTIFVQIALGLNMYISAQGQAKVAMCSVLVGAVANIILDPIFIFAMKMGVRGAALATIISQAISAIWVFWFLLSENSAIRIRKDAIKLDKKILMSTISLGLAPFIMRSTESFVQIVLNNGLQRYGGDAHVGAMTICLSVLQLVVVTTNGFTTGVQPIISYNFGAKNYDRAKQTGVLMTIVAFACSAVSSAIVMLFPGAFASLFSKDQELIELVRQVLPIFFSGMWIFGIQMSAQSIHIGLKRAKSALFLAVLRKLVLLIPLALLLPMKFGVMGIYWSEPISDTISALTSLVMMVYLFKQFSAVAAKPAVHEEALSHQS